MSDDIASQLEYWKTETLKNRETIKELKEALEDIRRGTDVRKEAENKEIKYIPSIKEALIQLKNRHTNTKDDCIDVATVYRIIIEDGLKKEYLRGYEDCCSELGQSGCTQLKEMKEE